MQFRFGSREWLAAANGIFAQRASCLAAQGISDRVSICEVYLNTPSDLSWEDNRLAWSCVYEGGAFEFALSEREDVDFKAVGNYDAFLGLSTYIIGSDPARETEYRALAMKAISAGEIAVPIGNGFREPGGLEPLHDVLAKLTSASLV